MDLVGNMNFIKIIKIRFTKVFSIFKRSTPNIKQRMLDNQINEPSEKLSIDPRTVILNDTNAKLNKLKLLASYFSKDILNKIKDQTEIVFDIFSKNKDLNYKKLEQFNYYYTDNLLELLSKLKKSKEENILILTEKLSKAKNNANSAKIIKIDFKKVDNERRKYASIISDVLAANYRELCNYSGTVNIKYTHKETLFLSILPNENYYTIPFEVYEDLANIETDLYYNAKNYNIHKKLMGKLNKNVFNIDYVYSFKSVNNDEIYVFQIKDTSDFFIYIPDKKTFKLINSTDIMPLANSSNSSWSIITTKLEEDIKTIEDLEYRISKEKTITDESVIATLESYYKKINNDELMTSLSDVDVDRQFLDEVLKLEQFKI